MLYEVITHLLEEAQKLFKLKKLGAIRAPEVSKKPESKPLSPTLSNSSAQTMSDKTSKLMDDSELKKAAASLLKWD